MKQLTFTGQHILVIGLVVGFALALGWLTKYVFVVLVPSVMIGVLAGAMTGFFGLINPGWTPLIRKITMVGAIVLGFVALAVMDDMHHRDSFHRQVALAAYADSGAEGAPESEDELAFFERGASDVLATNMEASVGFTGPFARWLHRVDGGIRTFGSWERRRVIPAGRTLSLLFLAFEVGLSFWFGLRVLQRIGVNQAKARTRSERHAPNFQDKGDEDEGTAS